MGFQSLDLDGEDAECAEIERYILVRTASQLNMAIPGKDDEPDSRYQAWGDLFGEVGK